MTIPNPGTTDGGQPQKDATTEPKKKIAGKFDTIEEAVEKGYTGLEAKMHEISGTVGKLVKVLETALAAPNDGGVGIGSRGNDDGYNRGGHVADDDIDPVEFLKNPKAVLAKRDEKLAQRISGQVVDLVGNMMAVNAFKAQNQDLVKHEKLVQAFVRDEDQSLPVSERLDNAAKKAREYLKSLKVDLNADLPNRAPRGEEYNEAPTAGAPNRRPNTPTTEDGEADLVAYINERNREMAEHFGPVKK